MKFLIIITLIFSANITHSYYSEVVDFPLAYETKLIEDISQTKSYLGELKDFPEMYELVVDEDSLVEINLQQAYRGIEAAHDFGLIIIKPRSRNRGVEEIARQNISADEWSIEKDNFLGLTLLESKKIKLDLKPGIYKVEVSTAENIGRYSLIIESNKDDYGYFPSLLAIRRTQAHFGYSFFQTLKSSQVYYPIFVFIVLFAGFGIYKWRIKTPHDF